MKTMQRVTWLSAFSTLLLTACAGTDFATVPDSAADKNIDGIRYYENALFVLVTSDGKGGLTASTKWLPDTTRIRVLRPYAIAAKNNATYTFSNGVLTSAKNEVDETIIPAAIIAAAKDAVLTRFGNADAGGAGTLTVVPPPALFRVVVNVNGAVSLRGSYGQDEHGVDTDIHITVSQPAKQEGGK